VATTGLAGCSSLGLGGSAGKQSQVDGWRTIRGTPNSTGLAGDRGPSADIENEFTSSLRDGTTLAGSPLVGSDGLYELGLNTDAYEEDPPTFAIYAYGLSSEDGSERWRQKISESTAVQAYRQIRRVIDSDSVYGLWVERTDDSTVTRLVSISQSNGDTQWGEHYPTSEIGEPVGYPTVFDGTLYQTLSSGLVAFDTDDGSLRWKREDLTIESRSLAVNGEGIVVVVRGDDWNEVALLNPEDGSTEWREPINWSVNADPVIADGSVYVADGTSFYWEDPRVGSGTITLPPRKVYSLSVSDGSTEWSHTYEPGEVEDGRVRVDDGESMLMAGGTSSLTVVGDHVYFALMFPNAAEYLGRRAEEDQVERLQNFLYQGPNVFALDRSDGSVAWEQTLGDRAGAFLPSVADSDHLYVQNMAGGLDSERSDEIYVLDRSDGSVITSFGPISDTPQPFAVAGETLYVHTGDEIEAWR